MKTTRWLRIRFVGIAFCLAWIGVLAPSCSGLTCGAGTVERDGQCVVGTKDEDPSLDPRCRQLCAIKKPDVEGAYDICSQKSSDNCKASCQLRVKDVSPACAICLLEDADFGPDGGTGVVVPGFPSSSGILCETKRNACEGKEPHCVATGRGGRCEYCYSDQKAKDDCVRKVFPRREVDCTAEFRSIDECANFCKTG